MYSSGPNRDIVACAGNNIARRVGGPKPPQRTVEDEVMENVRMKWCYRVRSFLLLDVHGRGCDHRGGGA